MYILDETVLQLYQMIGEIPSKYGVKPMVILSEVIANNEKSKKIKEGEKENDTDVSDLSE